MVYLDLGGYEAAKALIEKILSNDIKNFGPDHPTVATRYNEFAMILLDRNDFQKAKSYFQEAYRIWIAALGPEHPKTKDVKKILDNWEKLVAHYKAKALKKQNK